MINPDERKKQLVLNELREEQEKIQPEQATVRHESRFAMLFETERQKR